MLQLNSDGQNENRPLTSSFKKKDRHAKEWAQLLAVRAWRMRSFRSWRNPRAETIYIWRIWRFPKSWWYPQFSSIQLLSAPGSLRKSPLVSSFFIKRVDYWCHKSPSLICPLGYANQARNPGPRTSENHIIRQFHWQPFYALKKDPKANYLAVWLQFWTTLW